MVRSLAPILSLFLVMGTPDVHAHPLHTSHTVIARDRAGRLSVMMKVFRDDFSGAIDALARSTGATHPEREVLVRRYVTRMFSISTSDGRRVALTWCGMKTEGNQVTICLMAGEAVRGSVRVRQELLLDWFADQVNIVRWTTPSASRMLVLSHRCREASLP